MAAGRRLTWSDLPAQVQSAVEDILGGRVSGAASQIGGFSPGSADRVVTTSGRRAFVKAVSAAQNPHTPDLHRREARIASALPASEHVPGLLGTFDDGGWVAVVLEDVEGRHPVTPWVPAELDAVLAALAELSTSLTPSPVPGLPTARSDLADDFDGWARVQADAPSDLDPWVKARLADLVRAAGRGLEALEGRSLLHTDLRSDNVLVRPDGGVVFVDWPWASLGPAWLDVLLLLVNVNLFGGHDMEALVSKHLAEVPAEEVTGVLTGLAGYFVDVARLPPPDGIPTIRDFQRDQGFTALRWLKQRMP